jgi:glycosyltransferase involved in cell wall biosynthesis
VTSVAVVTQGLRYGGGVPSAVWWLTDHLRSVGYTVKIFDLSMSATDELNRSPRVPRSMIRSTLRGAADSAGVERWGANLGELEFMRYLPRRELTRELNTFDVVHVLAGGPALGTVARNVDVPVVLQIASVMRWERERLLSTLPPGRGFYVRAMTRTVSAMEGIALRSAGEVLVMNDVLARHVAAVTGRPVHKAAPGVDTERFRPATTGWDREGPIVSVCRLGDARKGLLRLVEAYRMALDEDSDLPPLCLAGLGPAPEELVQAVQCRRLTNHVSIREDVPAEDLPELLRGASVFVQASYEEGLGIAVLEAAASGVPTVATATSGTIETVAPGRTGYLVEQGVDSDVSRGLSEGMLHVRTQGSRLATEARLHCEREFSSRVMLTRHRDAYVRLLGSEGQRPSS